MESVNTNEILKKYGLKLTKALGQNFLIDLNIIQKIVGAGDVGPEDFVLEIGPGIGAMTLQLAKVAGCVRAVEIDKKLIAPLQEVLAYCPNTAVIHSDIMDVDLAQLTRDWPGPLKVVSNLPYYITTPIIMRLLESDVPWDTLVFMVQKEVALRIAASPGGRDFSVLSLAVQYHADPKVAFTVSPNCFVPRPDVDSAVVCLKRVQRPVLEGVDKALFFKTVKACFGQRRKTILNSLGGSPWLPGGKNGARLALAEAGIPEGVRAETLSLEMFVQLTNAVGRLQSGAL